MTGAYQGYRMDDGHHLVVWLPDSGEFRMMVGLLTGAEHVHGNWAHYSSFAQLQRHIALSRSM